MPICVSEWVAAVWYAGISGDVRLAEKTFLHTARIESWAVRTLSQARTLFIVYFRKGIGNVLRIGVDPAGFKGGEETII